MANLEGEARLGLAAAIGREKPLEKLPPLLGVTPNPNLGFQPLVPSGCSKFHSLLTAAALGAGEPGDYGSLAPKLAGYRPSSHKPRAMQRLAAALLPQSYVTAAAAVSTS